jgi:hypothetical protein
LSYSDGSIYTGNFANDYPNGRGEKVFVDGSIYTGEFLDGQFHGIGKYK